MTRTPEEQRALDEQLLEVIYPRNGSTFGNPPDWRLEQAKQLLAQGADPNAQEHETPNRDYAVHLAIRSLSPAMLNLLVQAGANIDEANAAGNTPLHIAAIQQSLKMTDCTLALGANPNAQSLEENTPLHVGMENSAVIFSLLRGGADATITNKDGKNVPEMAKRLGGGRLEKLENELDELRDAIRPASVPEGELDKAELLDSSKRHWELTPRNIGFWQQFEVIAERLADQGEPLTQDNFHWPGENGDDHLLDQAWLFFQLPKALKALAKTGVYLQPDDVVQEGEPLPFVKEMGESGVLHQFFHPDNWRGAEPEQFIAVYRAMSEALPEKTQAQVLTFNQVLAELRQSHRQLQQQAPSR